MIIRIEEPIQSWYCKYMFAVKISSLCSRLGPSTIKWAELLNLSLVSPAPDPDTCEPSPKGIFLSQYITFKLVLIINPNFNTVFEFPHCFYLQIIKTLCQERNQDIRKLDFSLFSVMVMGPGQQYSCLRFFFKLISC